MIDRNDMLELTRRMTPDRFNFSRIAGAYFDEEGFVEGTFNTSFLKLKPHDRDVQLGLVKAIPFSKTNKELISYRLPKERTGPNNIWQLLDAVKDCELKNDALLDVMYEIFGDAYVTDGKYGLYVCYSNYDVPAKGADNCEQWESEEVYKHMIFAFCPVDNDYNPGAPEFGFLYPAFSNRSTDFNHINIFTREGCDEHPEIIQGLFKLK